MSIETATYISDLAPLNPTHTDGLNQADSHLRLIKSTLQTTFPNVTGAVTSTHTDLNTAGATNTAVTAMAANRVRNDIAQSLTGPLTVSGSVSASSLLQSGNALVPTGIIAMWAGLTTNVPAGWHLCDGTNGTPNLIGMFIVGAGSGGPAAGQTGGSNIQTITSSTVGPHSHGGATVAVGNHAHTGAVGGYALQTADIPAHAHGLTDLGHVHSIATGLVFVQPGATGIIPVGGGGTPQDTAVAGTGIVVNNTGGGGSHTHGITADGAHSHTINSDNSHSHTVAIDVRPTYYAVCLIMKL